MRKILVSGGSRGIGRQIVESFCKAGDSVAFIYNRSEKEASELAERTGAYPIRADLSFPENTEKAVAECVNALGGIDVLVCSQGISSIKPFTDFTHEEISALLSVDLVATMLLSQKACAHMVRKHSGRIITIGSMWGERGASCEVVYSAAKAGIRGFTKALAKELGPSGITVNCVEPGFILTDMNRDIPEDTVREIIECTPLGRAGTPGDIADAVLFLASEKASFITGQCIGVDGSVIL